MKELIGMTLQEAKDYVNALYMYFHIGNFNGEQRPSHYMPDRVIVSVENNIITEARIG